MLEQPTIVRSNILRVCFYTETVISDIMDLAESLLPRSIQCDDWSLFLHSPEIEDLELSAAYYTSMRERGIERNVHVSDEPARIYIPITVVDAEGIEYAPLGWERGICSLLVQPLPNRRVRTQIDLECYDMLVSQLYGDILAELLKRYPEGQAHTLPPLINEQHHAVLGRSVPVYRGHPPSQPGWQQALTELGERLQQRLPRTEDNLDRDQTYNWLDLNPEERDALARCWLGAKDGNWTQRNFEAKVELEAHLAVSWKSLRKWMQRRSIA